MRRTFLLRPVEPPFHLVLVAPEIPANTGNIARLCACTGARLHLVCPLGFAVDDRSLRRAGLDYWAEVHAETWASFEELEASLDLSGRGRPKLHLFSARAEKSHLSATFAPGDWLVFGRESRGLPEAVLERYADRTVALPMREGSRSLNLASTVAVALYEALRQTAAR